MTRKIRALEGTALSSLEKFTLLLLQRCSENKLPGNKAGFGDVIHAGKKNMVYVHVVLLHSHTHTVICGCASPSLSILLQQLTHSCSRCRKSMFTALLNAFLQFIELLCASGPEVQNRVRSAKPHLFHTVITKAAQVFNINQLAF